MLWLQRTIKYFELNWIKRNIWVLEENGWNNFACWIFVSVGGAVQPEPVTEWVSVHTWHPWICLTYLQCQPAVWDAKHLSAQKRSRFFWGNIPGLYRYVEGQLDTWLAFISDLLTVLWLEMSLYFCLFTCYFVFFWSFCLFVCFVCLFVVVIVFGGTQLFLFGRVCWKVDCSCSVPSYCKWWCYCCLWSSCSPVAAVFFNIFLYHSYRPGGGPEWYADSNTGEYNNAFLILKKEVQLPAFWRTIVG